MKKITLFAVVCGLSISSSIWAESTTPDSSTATDGKQSKKFEKCLKKFDQNGDGKLDEAEKALAQKAREERRQKRLAKWDVNHDGKLDESEKSAMKQAMAEKKAKSMEKWDVNHDGKLDTDEKAARKASHQTKKSSENLQQ